MAFEWSMEEATKSLNTVAMILGNFLKDPSAERNRKVNTSGARFCEIFRNNSVSGRQGHVRLKGEMLNAN